MSLFSWKSSREKKSVGSEPAPRTTAPSAPSTYNYTTHVEDLEHRLVMVSNVIPGTLVPGLAFEDTFGTPPDPEGAVSDDFLLSIVNSAITWQARPDVAPPVNDPGVVSADLTSFFQADLALVTPQGYSVQTGLPTDYRAPTGNFVVSDGRVIYDEIFDRFVVAASVIEGNTSTIYLANSVSTNPNDGWFFQSIQTEFEGSQNFFGRENGGALVDPEPFLTAGTRLGMTRNAIVVTSTIIDGGTIIDTMINTITKPFFYEGGFYTGVPQSAIDTLRPFATDFFVARETNPDAVLFDVTLNVPGEAIFNGNVIGLVAGYFPVQNDRILNFRAVAGQDTPIALGNYTLPNQREVVVNDATTLLEDGEAELEIEALDEDGNIVSTATITVVVIANQDPVGQPSFFEFQTPNPLVPTTAVVGQAIAWDPDSAQNDPAKGQTLVYAITGGNDEGFFSINSNTGVITMNYGDPLDPPDPFTEPVELTVTVTDRFGASTETTVTITFVNVVGPTSLVAFSANFTYQTTDAANGDVVAVVPAYISPQAQAVFSYQIIDGNDDGAFAIAPTPPATGGSPGVITVADVTALIDTFQTTGDTQRTLTVQINGPGGLVEERVITITYLNDAPIVPRLPDGHPQEGQRILFGAPPRTSAPLLIGWVPGYDPDGLDNPLAYVDLDPTDGFLITPDGAIFITPDFFTPVAVTIDFAFDVTDGFNVVTESVRIVIDAIFPGIVPTQNYGNDGDSAFFVDFLSAYTTQFNSTGLAGLFRLDLGVVNPGFGIPIYAPLNFGVLAPGFIDPINGSAEAPWLKEFGTIPVDALFFSVVSGGGVIPTNAVFQPLASDPDGGVGRLWTANTLLDPVSELVAVRWYEFEVLTAAAQPVFFQGAVGGSPLQQGGVNTDTVAANSGLPLHTYAPAIQIDQFNNMAIAFAGSNANQLISAYYSGRFDADRFNPEWNGTTRPSKILMEGEDLYARGFYFAIWGRGSGLARDPIPGGGFWTYNAYAAPRSNSTDVFGIPNVFGSWATTWGQFILIPDRQVFIIDVSHSMNVVQDQNVTGDDDTTTNPAGNFADSSDDINGDGIVGSLIDLELAIIIRQWQSGLLSGMAGDPGEVAIIIYGTDAKSVVLDATGTGDERFYINPLADLNQNGKSDFIEAILGIREGRSDFIFETTIGTSFTNYAPPLELFRERTQDFPLDIIQGQMYSDGSGRLPNGYQVDPNLPPINTFVLGPFQFIGAVVDPTTGLPTFNNDIINDYVSISSTTLGLLLRDNRPAVNTIDGGYAPTVRVPTPEFTGSAAEGVTVTLQDGTVVTIFPDGSINVIPPIPNGATTDDEEDDTTTEPEPIGSVDDDVVVPEDSDTDAAGSMEETTDRSRDVSSSTSTLDSESVDDVFTDVTL